MRNLVLLVILLFPLGTIISQDERLTHDLQPFSELKAFDGLSIKLIKSTENKAVVTGANTKNVAIVNNGGVLKIRMEITKIFSGYRTFVNLYYTDKLVVIDVNEDARITSEEVIKQEVLELKAQEGGELTINTEVEQLLIKTVTGGVVEANGIADLQDVAINTGGIYKGKELNWCMVTL